MSMKRSHRKLAIDMVIDKGIVRKKPITLVPFFICIPKTGMGVPKAGLIFFCAGTSGDKRHFCGSFAAQN